MQRFRVFALGLFSLRLCAQSQAQADGTSERHSKFPEVEFVISDIFRSGTWIQPIWQGLHSESHYFAGERTDVGHAGAAWVFHWKGIRLAPGVGLMFGNAEFVTTPALSFRWEYEKGHFVTQGLLLHGIRQTAFKHEHAGAEAKNAASEKTYSVRPTISDGNHVSGRWRRVTLGGAWEHIQFREKEWKGGSRLALQLTRHASAILYVLGPGRAEFRAGLLIHPGKQVQ